MIGLLLLLTLTPIQALELTWEESYRLAAQQNPELNAARADLEAAKKALKRARYPFLPSIYGLIKYDKTGGNGRLSVGNFAGENYTTNLAASWNVFNGFSDWGNYKLLDATARERSADMRVSAAKAAYDLKSAFAGALYARDAIALTESIMGRRQDNMRMVELRFQSGRENKGSVLLAQAYFEQAKYDNLQARNASVTAMAKLNRILGLNGEPIVPKGELPMDEPGDKPDLEELAQATPQRAQVRAQVEEAEASITVAQAGFYPTLALTGSAGRSGPYWFPEPQYERWAVGAALTIPIFDGGRDYYGSQRAAVAKQAAEARQANINRDVLAKLQDAWAGWIESFSKFTVDRTFRDATQVRAEIARNKYNNGLMTFEDWDVIESDLIARQKTFLATRRDRAVAEALWEQVQGQGVTP